VQQSWIPGPDRSAAEVRGLKTKLRAWKVDSARTFWMALGCEK
jgi:hypothetical protein